jgi:hypothetical protein
MAVPTRRVAMNETSPLITSHSAVAVAEPVAQSGVATVASRPETAAGGGGGDKKESPRETLRSAGVRALRTFFQAFLAVITAGPVLSLGIPTYKAGLTAGVAAVLALANRLLDPTPIPTIPKG